MPHTPLLRSMPAEGAQTNRQTDRHKYTDAFDCYHQCALPAWGFRQAAAATCLPLSQQQPSVEGSAAPGRPQTLGWGPGQIPSPTSTWSGPAYGDSSQPAHYYSSLLSPPALHDQFLDTHAPAITRNVMLYVLGGHTAGFEAQVDPYSSRNRQPLLYAGAS